MGLFDIFNAPTGQINKAGQAVNQGIEKATGYVNQGANTALGNIGSNYSTAQDFLKNNQGINYVNSAENRAVGQLDQAKPLWQSLLNQGNAGIDLYGRLAGLNGSDMNSVLEQIPGYKFSVDQATQGIDRNRAAQGMLKSGNTNLDLANAINGIASGNYFNYLNALQPYFGLGQNAAQGMTGVLGDISNVITNSGNNQANLAAGYGTNASNVATGQGNALAGINTSRGNTLADLATAQGQNNADTIMNTANANQAASGQLWNALLGLGGLGTSIAGMSPYSLAGKALGYS